MSTLPTTITPSSEELSNNRLGSRNLEIAVRHLHQDGLVVIEDVVPIEHLDNLNSKMVEDALALQAKGEKGPFNFNQGNLQQDAPPVAQYFYPSIFTNPIATQVTSAVLGPKPNWTFCSANSAMPPLPGASPQRQPVHSDAGFDHPSHPFAFVVNIPLITMTPHNGSTELWLGTHTFGVGEHEGARAGRIKEHVLAEQRKTRGPSQPTVKKGSIVIRDLRLWHAGMPNPSDEVRIMLAMIHFAPWYRNQMRLELGEDIRPVLDELDRQGALGLEVPVDWRNTDDVLGSYLDRGHGISYSFDQI
ncbi:phytanoyl-CoA dioxygenase [Thozetella sp. PMI_491]|nr:phytanoyl-CoA dioxygenase [Thozetella sp. PMI_491]